MTITSTLVLPTIPLTNVLLDNTSGVAVDYWLHWGVVLTDVSDMSGLADGVVSGANCDIVEFSSTVGYARTSDGTLHWPFNLTASEATGTTTGDHTFVWPASAGVGVIVWSDSHHFAVPPTTNMMFSATTFFGVLAVDGGWTSCSFTLKPFYTMKTTDEALTVAEALAHPNAPIVFTA